MAVGTSGSYTKVLGIVEGNENFHKVLGGGSAPFLTSLSQKFGLATAMDAGYPTNCLSLAAYLPGAADQCHALALVGRQVVELEQLSESENGVQRSSQFMAHPDRNSLLAWFAASARSLAARNWLTRRLAR